jgi:hypothetical protein
MWHPPPPTSERLSRSLSPLDSTNPTQQLLLHHFARSASRITSCYPGIQTSFNSLLLPMAISYPPLLSALMALSAIHRNSLYTLPAATLQQPNEIDYLKASSVTQLRSDLLLPLNDNPKCETPCWQQLSRSACARSIPAPTSRAPGVCTSKAQQPSSPPSHPCPPPPPPTLTAKRACCSDGTRPSQRLPPSRRKACELGISIPLHHQHHH